jgi:large subunit ribosomal protein L24
MAARRSSASTARPKRRSLKIRTGDRVQVMSGKDRGKTGRVLRVEPTKERLYVEHLNMVKRHTRPQQVAGAQSEARLGGVIEREGPIHISNVMLLDAKGTPTRVAIERQGGERVRVAKSSGARLE